MSFPFYPNRKIKNHFISLREEVSGQRPSSATCNSVSLLVFSPPFSSSSTGFRESGLQEADEDERGQGTSAKRKRMVSEAGGENDVERWVMRRQRLRASRDEEAVKRKRTVFVGNLPISCTKKVSLSWPVFSSSFRLAKFVTAGCFYAIGLDKS